MRQAKKSQVCADACKTRIFYQSTQNHFLHVCPSFRLISTHLFLCCPCKQQFFTIVWWNLAHWRVRNSLALKTVINKKFQKSFYKNFQVIVIHAFNQLLSYPFVSMKSQSLYRKIVLISIFYGENRSIILVWHINCVCQISIKFVSFLYPISIYKRCKEM